MNKQDFIKAMQYLCTAYSKDFDEKQCTVWYKFFKDNTIQEFMNAIDRIIPKCKFMPSIAEVKDEIVVLSNKTLQLNAEDEWNNVLLAVRKFGSYRIDEAYKSLDPYTAEIVKKVGFQRICNSTDITWLRKDFIELFNDCKNNYKEILALPQSKLTLNEIVKKAQLVSEDIKLLEN